MANIKSQIKRNRQNEKRRIKNRVYRGAARTAIKKARTTYETGNAELSKAAVLVAVSMLDKAAQKGVIHKNNAARRKSRLIKQLAALGPTMAQEAAPAVEAEPVTPHAAGARKPARKTTRKTAEA